MIRVIYGVLNNFPGLMTVFQHPDYAEPVGGWDWREPLYQLVGKLMNLLGDYGIAGWWFFVILIGWGTYDIWKEYLRDRKKMRDKRRFKKKWSFWGQSLGRGKFWLFMFTLAFILFLILAISSQIFFFRHGYFGEFP